MQAHLQALILDLQSTARTFDEAAQASVERAVAETDRRLSVCPMALAIPTQGPLDSFGARTYPACYVEWWFGDGAPGLDRERPMLFEQVARRLINIEEHQYSLAGDAEPYKAACQSRFNNPEIIAVLGDVVRRMRLLKGTRAAIGRKGFQLTSKRWPVRLPRTSWRPCTLPDPTSPLFRRQLAPTCPRK